MVMDGGVEEMLKEISKEASHHHPPPPTTRSKGNETCVFQLGHREKVSKNKIKKGQNPKNIVSL